MLALSRRLALAGALTAVAGRARGQSREIEDSLGGVLASAVSQGRVVGAVLVVMQDGAELHGDLAGSADRERDIPVRRDTLFRLSGLSVPLVSAAALALIDRGALALDDPVTRTLPAFRPSLADGTVPVITVRHLLTHSAGLSYGYLQPPGNAYERAGVSDGMDLAATGLDDNIARLAALPLLYAPGSAHAPSLATDVLGAVIQHAVDAPLAEVVARHVTGPLGMTDTRFVVLDASKLTKPYANLHGAVEALGPANPLPLSGGGMLRIDPRRALTPSAYPSGGSGLVGTADDVIRFLEAWRSGRGGVLRPDPVGTGFGIARSVTRAGAFEASGILGTRFWIDPVGRRSAVLLTNTTPEGFEGTLPMRIGEAILEG